MKTKTAKHSTHSRINLDQVLEFLGTAGLSLVFKPSPKAAGGHRDGTVLMSHHGCDISPPREQEGQTPRERWATEDGDVGVLIKTSLRGVDSPTPDEEIDEHSEWLGGGQKTS